MSTLQLLLIEDTDRDAQMFINRVKQEMGNDVTVDRVTRLGEALSLLGSSTFDQIWLDLKIPDLQQKDVGKALTTLREISGNADIRILGSAISPAASSQAAKHNVEVLPKDDLISGNQLVQIVTTLLETKRGGTVTTRVEMAKIEGKLATLEYQLGLGTKKLEETIAMTRSLTSTIEQLQSKIGSLESKQAQQKDLASKKLDVLQAIAVALIALGTTVAATVLPKFLEKPTEKPHSVLVEPLRRVG